MPDTQHYTSLAYWLMTTHPHVFVFEPASKFACLLLEAEVVLTHSLMPM